MATTPIQFNATAIITTALCDIGAFMPGESIPAAKAQDALARLNVLVSNLQLSPLMFPFINREVFDVVAFQSTYTIGPGGDFDTIRPTSLTGAGLLMPSQSSTTGKIEIPRAIMTDDAYQLLQTKELTNAMFTDVYYNQSYTSGFGSVFLWPTPNTTTYQLVLYRGDTIQGFTNLTTTGSYPPGTFEVLEYGLGKRLAPTYGGAGWTPELEDLRRTAFFEFKRNNFKLTDLVLDPAMTHTHRTGYNIETGTGG